MPNYRYKRLEPDMAPKSELVLAWVVYWADTSGQFMPHKTEVVIYAANKEVRPADCAGSVRTCHNRLTAQVRCFLACNHHHCNTLRATACHACYVGLSISRVSSAIPSF